MQESLPQLILPIKLERSPERLTSLGGLVVLEELARAAGVWEKVDRRVEGPKSGRGVYPADIYSVFSGSTPRGDYASFAGFSDPDGNSWVLQERGYRNV